MVSDHYCCKSCGAEYSDCRCLPERRADDRRIGALPAWARHLIADLQDERNRFRAELDAIDLSRDNPLPSPFRHTYTMEGHIAGKGGELRTRYFPGMSSVECLHGDLVVKLFLDDESVGVTFTSDRRVGRVGVLPVSENTFRFVPIRKKSA